MSYNGEFMTDVMPAVGNAIRSAYHWMPPSRPIFLFLDNAGGHGMKEVIAAYVNKLDNDCDNSSSLLNRLLTALQLKDQ